MSPYLTEKTTIVQFKEIQPESLPKQLTWIHLNIPPYCLIQGWRLKPHGQKKSV